MVNCSEMPSKYALCKIYVCVHVYIYISKYLILILLNKKLFALKNIEGLQNFFQTVKHGNLYLNVLNISGQMLSPKLML